MKFCFWTCLVYMHFMTTWNFSSLRLQYGTSETNSLFTSEGIIFKISRGNSVLVWCNFEGTDRIKIVQILLEKRNKTDTEGCKEGFNFFLFFSFFFRKYKLQCFFAQHPWSCNRNIGRCVWKISIRGWPDCHFSCRTWKPNTATPMSCGSHHCFRFSRIPVCVRFYTPRVKTISYDTALFALSKVDKNRVLMINQVCMWFQTLCSIPETNLYLDEPQQASGTHRFRRLEKNHRHENACCRSTSIFPCLWSVRLPPTAKNNIWQKYVPPLTNGESKCF